MDEVIKNILEKKYNELKNSVIRDWHGNVTDCLHNDFITRMILIYENELSVQESEDEVKYKP
jgi:hypothetical protein